MQGLRILVWCATVLAPCAICGSALAPGTAQATTVRCETQDGHTMTIVDGETACASVSDVAGRALGFGIDNGIGYAKAERGARAVGVGMNGGVGASQGVGGVPAAVAIGPKSVAIASVDDGSISIALALDGSQALVGNREHGVFCQGSSALAWNATTGAACLSTPDGPRQYP